MTTSILLHAGCAALYLLLTAMILIGRRRDRTRFALAGACLVTAGWAAGIALDAAVFGGGRADDRNVHILELAQQAAWYGFALHLYSRAVPNGSRLVKLLSRLGLVAILGVVASIGTTTPLAERLGFAIDPLAAFGIDARLGLAICTLLLIENLYRNSSDDLRWHIALPCVALGGLYVYDIVLYSDAALFRRTSAALFDGRAVVTALLTPLLALSAQRNRRRWGLPSPTSGTPIQGVRPAGSTIKVSQQAVFYSATLVVTGVFLLALALTGELLRQFMPGRSPGWGALIEVTLICGGVLAVAVLLTSGSARSSLRNLLINNFLTPRYDYRLEWLRCIETLSQANSHVALHTRVIKAVAQTVDSPAGLAFLCESAGNETVAYHDAFRWAGSWNLPPSSMTIPPNHPSLALFGDGSQVVQAPAVTAFITGSGPDGAVEPHVPAADGLGMQELWLAVPLCHTGRLIGFILLSRPRAAFTLDQEVFALLRIVGQEVASYIAEQRAAEALVQARQLREYGQRFAFVAHDIKNLASQLSLLLANAEHHIANPAFQQDMLTTIGGSVQKITGLLARLKAPAESTEPALLSVAARLASLVGAYHPARRRRIQCQPTQSVGSDADGEATNEHVRMEAAAFDSVMSHLLDNAFEASADDHIVRIVTRVTSEPGQTGHHRRVLIDIIDEGVGMTADFIREELFRPFRSSKREGFGIGVYQARELLRQAGGDLIVISAPGRGTTMRLSLPSIGEPAVARAEAVK